MLEVPLSKDICCHTRMSGTCANWHVAPMHVYHDSSACTIFYFWPTLSGRTGVCKSGNGDLTARVKRHGPVEERPAVWHNVRSTNNTFPVRRLGVYGDHLVNSFCPDFPMNAVQPPILVCPTCRHPMQSCHQALAGSRQLCLPSMSWCQLLCLTIRFNKHEVGLAQASVQHQRQRI